jgi:hypothetical protein
VPWGTARPGYDQRREQEAAAERERAEQRRREVDEAADRMKFGKD